MAVVTTNLLNAVKGTHAGGVGVRLLRRENSGAAHTKVFEHATDASGRLAQVVDIGKEHVSAEYELVFQTGRYFSTQNLPEPSRQCVKEVVIRFVMPDPDASYHIPLMISPNSYSVWWSS